MAAGVHRPAEPARVAVAVSGGLDSTCLLHATWRWARERGVEVHALHVHHGLQPAADQWQRAVAARCRRWTGITLHAHRVESRPAAGDSVEAWARRQRYAALGRLAREAGCTLVLLAHHRRDQAETVLLQALRGGGPAGLAAMPRLAERDGLMWARPWLEQPRSSIESYARRWRLRGVDDPSNTDARWARSRLRQQVWPVLQQAFGDAEGSLLQVARRAHEVRELLDEVALVDLAQVCDAQGLRRQAWQGLSPARRANVLRHWLQAVLGRGAPESLVQRLLRELPQATAARWPAGKHWLALHRGRLMVLPQVSPRAAPDSPGGRPVDLSQPGCHALPGGGAYRVWAVAHGGLPASLLAMVAVRPRQGGDRFQSHTAGVPRSLKKQYQAAGVPGWQRDAPLVATQGQLVFVPGLGADARALAQPGEPRLALEWQPGAP